MTAVLVPAGVDRGADIARLVLDRVQHVVHSSAGAVLELAGGVADVTTRLLTRCGRENQRQPRPDHRSQQKTPHHHATVVL